MEADLRSRTPTFGLVGNRVALGTPRSWAKKCGYVRKFVSIESCSSLS
jgi:hypothetical protein